MTVSKLTEGLGLTEAGIGEFDNERAENSKN
jgi:hypothetical protein